jgi:hypothetical protein
LPLDFLKFGSKSSVDAYRTLCKVRRTCTELYGVRFTSTELSVYKPETPGFFLISSSSQTHNQNLHTRKLRDSVHLGVKINIGSLANCL